MFKPPLNRQPTQEILLLDLVERLGRLRTGRVAVRLHLSTLPATFRRAPYLNVAQTTFAASVRHCEGQLFALGNADLVFVGKKSDASLLDTAVNRLRVIFGEPEQAEFCTWYDLETAYDALLALAQDLLGQAEKSRLDQELHPSIDPNQLLTPMQPDLLVKLEQALAKTDVTSIARRQTVCSIIEDQPPQPLFEEYYISIEDLQSIATPGSDLLGDRWLFQRLTQTLDRRMMAMMARDGINPERPFSLNLNIATVLSPDFARFEATITRKTQSRLVIELDKLDVFSDMDAFLFARDYLHELGFRVCLDGLTHRTLPYYDRARLGFDLIKIYWTPDSLDTMPEAMFSTIRSIVMETGQSRTILCRCENEQAVAIGQDLGIVMFQGRHVDRLLTLGRAA